MVHALPLRVSRLAHRPLLPLLLAGLFLAPATYGPLAGQEAMVQVEENLRAEPNGVVVAVVATGTPLTVVRQQGNWVEVVLEGWVWTASLRVRDSGSFDFQVSADQGENLRAEPSGTVLARLESGTLLQQVERVPGWVRVRRQAWMWAPSVEIRADAPAPTPAQGTTAGEAVRSGGDGTRSVLGIFRPERAIPILGSPDGDTLSTAREGTELVVTAREGNWARVRVEGWVWMPPTAETEVARGGEEEVSPTVTTVMGDPERYQGRIVTWTLQFISLERAEAIRTDFYEGEPFLLTRPVDGAGTRFIYVAVPPEALAMAGGLVPLERITVVGRIRTGSSDLTGSPILDLVELRRVQ